MTFVRSVSVVADDEYDLMIVELARKKIPDKAHQIHFQQTRSNPHDETR